MGTNTCDLLTLLIHAQNSYLEQLKTCFPPSDSCISSWHSCCVLCKGKIQGLNPTLASVLSPQPRPLSLDPCFLSILLVQGHVKVFQAHQQGKGACFGLYALRTGLPAAILFQVSSFPGQYSLFLLWIFPASLPHIFTLGQHLVLNLTSIHLLLHKLSNDYSGAKKPNEVSLES